LCQESSSRQNDGKKSSKKKFHASPGSIPSSTVAGLTGMAPLLEDKRRRYYWGGWVEDDEELLCVDFTTLPCFRLTVADLDVELVAAFPLESDTELVVVESLATLLSWLPIS
jgi:hypothetical protein